MLSIKNNNLIIEIPLYQKRSSPYEKGTWQGENIIGVIEPEPNCSDNKCGLAYRIDMSYKGKPDQHTDFFYIHFEGEKDFVKICKKLDIEIIKYDKCAKCGNPIYGCSTWSDKGYICIDCE